MYESIPNMQKESDNNLKILSDLEDELYELNSKYYYLFDENEILKKKSEDNEDKIKDINIKLQDFNIIDLIKGNLGTEGGDMNILLGLISNAEKKTSAKHKLIDEKIGKIDETCFKMSKDVLNVKNTQELNKRQFEAIKNELEDLKNNYESLNKNVDMNNEEINEKLETKITYIENKLKESFEKLNDKINKKFNTIDENMNNGKESQKGTQESGEDQNTNLENNKIIKMLREAITEAHKKIKSLPNQNDIEQIRTDISSLKSGINNSVRLSDFKEVKEMQEDNRSNIKKLREEFEDFQINQNENNDIQNIKRKLEIVINKVHDMEENDNQLNKKETNNSKTILDDKNKFLDSKTYDEFRIQIVKEFNNINENFINSRKLLDELIDSVRNRTSFKDLKALEDAVMSKMEDLKISSGKKFADRNEVNRSIKYLDQQIRNIVQIYIKRIDKGDNWLLAKKPITNNLCASCESYIGDLKDSNNNLYIPWNKYPVKDSNDKLYRMGHGFSKMLQMIQVDENDKKSAFQTYNEMNDLIKKKNNTKTDFFSASGIDVSEMSPYSKNLKNFNNLTVNMNRTAQRSLPKLKKNVLKKKNVNLTSDQEQNMNINDDSDENEYEPKITKIIRVTKDPH